MGEETLIAEGREERQETCTESRLRMARVEGGAERTKRRRAATLTRAQVRSIPGKP